MNVTRLTGNQLEASIAVDPVNSSRVVVLSNREPQIGLFAAFSIDGGTSWSSSAGPGDTSPSDFLIADGNDSLATADCRVWIASACQAWVSPPLRYL